MVEFIPSANISAAGLNGGGNLPGLDIMTSIQILLVQDYDDQLRSMGNQMNGMRKIKQAYRREIEELQKLLTQPTEKKKLGKGKNKDKNKKEYVPVTGEGFSAANTVQEHIFNPETGKVESYDSKEFGSLTKKTDKHGKTYVEKDAIIAMIDQVKLKLESVNEQSELMSLSIQSLANQRKIAFETISNLINKEHDTVATIVRNMKG